MATFAFWFLATYLVIGVGVAVLLQHWVRHTYKTDEDSARMHRQYSAMTPGWRVLSVFCAALYLIVLWLPLVCGCRIRFPLKGHNR